MLQLQSMTFENLERQYRVAQEFGYQFLTCEQYADTKHSLSGLTVVNRVDIDESCRKANRLFEMFERLEIKATFFVRLHAYNIFSFENYRILKSIRNAGHEIGYHSEVMDQAHIWGEDPVHCLQRDLDILNRCLDVHVVGIASHGGKTGINNLDFWRERRASDFGLKYEAYDDDPTFGLFNRSLYISDSEDVRWKCYQNGKLVADDNRSFGEHVASKPPLIYLLVHPDAKFDRHIYE